MDGELAASSVPHLIVLPDREFPLIMTHKKQQEKNKRRKFSFKEDNKMNNNLKTLGTGRLENDHFLGSRLIKID